MVAPTSEEVKQAVRAAFTDSQRPPRPVTEHRCPECDRVDALLGNRSWSEVARDFPQYCHDTFPLLTLEAQIYYLPAYMLAALEPEADMQGLSLESALQSEQFTPERFTPAQRAAISQWLLFYWEIDGGSGDDETADGLRRWII